MCTIAAARAKIMVTSFKRSRACTATLSAPNPAAGHHQPMPPLETPGHKSLGQIVVGSLLLSPGSWCTGICLCPPRVYFPVCVSSGSSMVGLMSNLLQEGLCHTQVCCTQIPRPCGSPPPTLNLLRQHSNTVLSQSLWGSWVLVLTRFVLSPLKVSSGNGV